MTTRTTLSIVAAGLLAVSGIAGAENLRFPGNHLNPGFTESGEVIPSHTRVDPWIPTGLASIWSASRGSAHIEALKKQYEGVELDRSRTAGDYTPQGFSEMVYAEDHGLGS